MLLSSFTSAYADNAIASNLVFTWLSDEVNTIHLLHPNNHREHESKDDNNIPQQAKANSSSFNSSTSSISYLRSTPSTPPKPSDPANGNLSMERVSVPFLKHGGLIRDLTSAEEKRLYEKERPRIRKVKKMIAMGQSQLLMPSQHHNQSCHQSQRQSRNRSGSRSEGLRSETSNGVAESFVLTGSEFIEQKAKPYLTPLESRCARKEIKEALESEMFNVWTVYDEEGSDQGGKDKDKGKEKVRGILEDSAVLLGSHKKRRREDIAKEWKAKEEKDIVGRARVSGGYDDVVEMQKLRNLVGFAPSLLGVLVEDYQRGQYTDEEDEWDKWSMIRRRERMEPITRWGGGGKQSWSVKDEQRKRQAEGRCKRYE
ncbi:hypothetical protein BKA65DRAFT_574834 [Rhexocercosporidium sp. MPI-PUGE-AT-0058]|nr:hypothetical protein BKA65DRAFT_574834 [Rhexocercosporidium sp. MPI-PUGE-AT-0058]